MLSRLGGRDTSEDAVVIKALSIGALAAIAAFAQPGQLAPAQPSASLNKPGANYGVPKELEGVGIDQKLNTKIPLDLVFRDEHGQQVPLSRYFSSGKPVILAPVYYRCPMLCTQILNGLTSALKAVSFDPGRDFEVVAFSFDPLDTPELAAQKKDMYMRRYGRSNTANGFHFLSGEEGNIKKLMDAVGFHYRYDPAIEQYAHASGVMIITPDGRLSKYFYGVEYTPRDLRLGLVEASHNKIGSPVDKILLFCYHYDPVTGKYGAIAMNMVRLAGAGFVLIGGVFLFASIRRERRSQQVTRTV